jgi:hypothetical protein
MLDAETLLVGDKLMKELEFLDDKYKYLVQIFLTLVPDYFWTIPASSTGKYHPKYAGLKSGLVLHTIAAIKIAKELFTLEQYNFSPFQQQLIITALAIHDTYKLGEVAEKYTVTEHPIIAARKFYRFSKDCLPLLDRLIISTAIMSHMGQWNKEYKTNEVVLPKPVTKIQKFVHLCDYLASRKFLEVTFD